jgi:hypothetical protein
VSSLIEKAASRAEGPERREIVSRSCIAALFLVVAGSLAFFHARETPGPLKQFRDHQPDVRALARELRALRPELPKGARILFLDDPFPVGDDWSLLFLVRLLYHDLSLEVGRARPNARPGREGRYGLALDYRAGRLTVVSDDAALALPLLRPGPSGLLTGPARLPVH